MFKDLDKVAYLNILHSKETFDDGKLLNNLPEEMVDFLKYVNNLRFEQDPNYSFMKGCFQKILTRLNFHKANINFSWINSKKIKLVSKISFDETESSRNRILKNLEKNKSKKSTIDSDNNINNNDNISSPREIANTSDENKINKNEDEKNTVLRKQPKHNDEIVYDIRNKTYQLQENSNSFINNNKNQIKQKTIQSNNIYINDNNNNIFQNNNDLRCDINNKNRNMNVDITYHKKNKYFCSRKFS